MALEFTPYPERPEESTTDQLNNLAAMLAQIAQQRQGERFIKQDRTLKQAGLLKDYSGAVGELGEGRAKSIYGPALQTMGIDPTIEAWNQYAQNRQTPGVVQDAGSDTVLNPDEQAYLSDATGFTQQRGRIEGDRVQKGLQAKKLAKDLLKKESPEGIRPPPGFRYLADGNLEPIPGGPASIKLEKEQGKEKGLRDAAISQADLVISKVDQALSKVGGYSAGLGSRLSVIPGTTARDLKGDIDTIKANLGFATLQEMRRNSPTGGALGQVAVQELEMLQATVAALDTAQSPEQLRQRLGEVKQHYEGWKRAVQGEEGSTPLPSSGGLDSVRKVRLQELRAKRDAGTLRR